jgi:hypothetical protein
MPWVAGKLLLSPVVLPPAKRINRAWVPQFFCCWFTKEHGHSRRLPNGIKPAQHPPTGRQGEYMHIQEQKEAVYACRVTREEPKAPSGSTGGRLGGSFSDGLIASPTQATPSSTRFPGAHEAFLNGASGSVEPRKVNGRPTALKPLPGRPTWLQPQHQDLLQPTRQQWLPHFELRRGSMRRSSQRDRKRRLTQSRGPDRPKNQCKKSGNEKRREREKNRKEKRHSLPCPRGLGRVSCFRTLET